MKKNLIIIFLLSVSCTSMKNLFRGREQNYLARGKINEYQTKDYRTHMIHLGEFYRSYSKDQISLLPRKHLKYFKKIYLKIVENNEVLLKRKKDPKIFVVKNTIPFYFSLPDNTYYLSAGLIDKYIKTEELLFGLYAFEIIKSQKDIYKKSIIIPTGNISTERMLSLARLPFDIRMEIGKWTFIALKRAGLDPSGYLNLIQAKNKNTMDFRMQLGDIISVAREEFEFKKFIVKYGFKNENEVGAQRNSSKEFYSFKQYILEKYD